MLGGLGKIGESETNLKESTIVIKKTSRRRILQAGTGLGAALAARRTASAKSHPCREGSHPSTDRWEDPTTSGTPSSSWRSTTRELWRF